MSVSHSKLTFLICGEFPCPAVTRWIADHPVVRSSPTRFVHLFFSQGVPTWFTTPRSNLTPSISFHGLLLCRLKQQFTNNGIMAPKNVDFVAPAAPLLESEPPQDAVHDAITEPNKRPPMRIVWRNVAIFAYLHLAAIYGIYLTPSAQYSTWAWSKCKICIVKPLI